MKIVFALILSILLNLVSCGDGGGSLRKTFQEEEEHRLLQNPPANPCFWCNPLRTECIELEDRPGKYTCICRAGYKDPPYCGDINECEENNACSFEGGLCVDMDGTYSCFCDTNNGYTAGTMGVNGAEFCTTAEDDCGGEPCHPSATCNLASLTCECDAGLVGDGVTACNVATPAPIDPSSTPAPITNAPIPSGNAVGGFCNSDTDCNMDNSFCDPAPISKCRCLDGYFAPAGLGGVCQVRDFCNEDNTDCDKRTDAAGVRRSVCNVKPPEQGFFQCQCNTGWIAAEGSADGIACVDFDECLLNETNSCDAVLEHCVNTNPPSKYFCVPATPAPTPAPSPMPTAQLCSISTRVECFDTANPTVACNTIAQCRDCAPSKLCFTYTPNRCNSTNPPSGWVSCVDDTTIPFADPMTYSFGAYDDATGTESEFYGTGTVNAGDEFCAEDATALPERMEVTLATAGGDIAQTINLFSDCSVRTLTFGSVFGSLVFSSYNSPCRGSWPPAATTTLDATVKYVARNDENSNPDTVRIPNFNRTILPTGASYMEQLNLTEGLTSKLVLDPPIREYMVAEQGTLTFDLTTTTNITVLLNGTGINALRSDCSVLLLYQIPGIKAVP